MAQRTGKTDTSHRVTLPSEIDRVRWSRLHAAPGGTVGLEIRTVFCGDGSVVEITLVDGRGTVHDSLSGKLVGHSVSVDLSVPTNATGALIARVTMPNHGLSAESPPLHVTEPIRVRGPRWSTASVQRGDIVTLTADARGARDGRRADVRIFEQGPGRAAPTPVTHLSTPVKDEQVTVNYQFQYPGDTANILPAWEAPNGYTKPSFLYRVDVCGIRADSSNERTRGLLSFVDDLTLQVVDAPSGIPYGEETVDLTLPTGERQTATLDETGTVTLTELPPGPVWVALPEPGAPSGPPIDSGKSTRDAIATRSSNGALSVQVATGASWRVWTGHRSPLLSE